MIMYTHTDTNTEIFMYDMNIDIKQMQQNKTVGDGNWGKGLGVNML